MKRLMLAGVFALAPAVVMAQEVTCGDYSLMDNAKQMETIAAIESETSQMTKATALTPDEIHTKLAADCKDKVDMLVIELVKTYKGG